MGNIEPPRTSSTQYYPTPTILVNEALVLTETYRLRVLLGLAFYISSHPSQVRVEEKEDPEMFLDCYLIDDKMLTESFIIQVLCFTKERRLQLNTEIDSTGILC